MANEVVETSVITGETIVRDYTQAEKDAIAAAQAEAKKNFDALDYKSKRMSEYPSIQDQLDDIYHNGISGWSETIKVTKDKYPKG